MPKNKKLDDIRKRIDEVDRKLVDLISDRAALAAKIAGLKREEGIDVAFYRPEREAEVLRRVIGNNKGPLADKEIARLFRELMSACLALEQVLSVGYLGPEGTFTHQALLKHFGHSVNSVALQGIDQVFRQVQSGTCNYGVVPIENSIEGVVNQTLDMLVDSNLEISGEVELRIHQQLMNKSGNRKNIEKIYSHQQSFAQCRSWLDIHFPSIERIPVISNAEAARLAAGDRKSAAIAGEAVAGLYKLTILGRNIEDLSDNITRFLIIGEHDTPPGDNDKTSLLFSMPSRPGSLVRMLNCFAGNAVNMTRIESRPLRKGTWEYMFFVDIDGHRQNKKVAAAIQELESEASMVKILGSYPKAVL